MNIIKQIKKNVLFKDFDEKEINAMFDCLKSRIVKYSTGTIIAHEDTQIEEIGILIKGTLLKYVTRSNGTREPINTLAEGEMFGEIEGYLPTKILPYSVLAADDVTVLYINIESIVHQCDKCCPHHQKLINNMLSYLASCVKSMNRDNEYLAIKSMRLKISKFLYDKYLEQGTLNLQLGINRNEMAEYLNVSRPSMSREMIFMREDGIITFWKDKITITNLEKLTEIVGKRF